MTAGQNHSVGLLLHIVDSSGSCVHQTMHITEARGKIWMLYKGLSGDAC